VGTVSKVTSGARFGRLTTIAPTPRRQWGQIVWQCRCDCSTDVEVTARNLFTANTRSCGCLRTDMTRVRNRQNASHDLRREIAELAAAHNIRSEFTDAIPTWQTKVTVTCPACGRKRNTDVAGFLRHPLACRRCSKRMPAESLRAILAERMIRLERVEYGLDASQNGRGTVHCECAICHYKFQRTVGELVSGNRGCPSCLNVQEMYARVILTHNLGGAFAIRKRPKWMKGLELDGWNTEVSFDGRSVAFEYMGRYWHKRDGADRAKTQRKFDLCAKNGVLLIVVWATADRPSWDDQLSACQLGINDAGLEISLELPPPDARDRLAKAIPRKVRERLAAINHEAIGYDLTSEHRGYVRSLCRISGNEVSQSAHTLEKIRGCRYCQAHLSRRDERRLGAQRGARAMWQAHRNGAQYPHVKITDEVVVYIRTHDFRSDAQMRERVVQRFGIEVSQSGLQYARSGRTHSHLNRECPPIRKAASPYSNDHPVVKIANRLRDDGMSLGKIAQVLFQEEYRTLKGTAFSAAQVAKFVRWAQLHQQRE